MPRRIILKTALSPGDLCTLTAAIESLHRSYPGWFLTGVDTACNELFDGNPHVASISPKRAEVLEVHYTDWINRCNHAPLPFLGGYCDDIAKRLNIGLTLQTNRPHLYLTDQELQSPPLGELNLPEDYWVVCAGVKRDFTLKQWPVEYYQHVLNHFSGSVAFVQIGDSQHDHPVLSGAINLVGRTNLRQLMSLVSRGRGGLGPITLLQHLCAAFEKPYVALFGGREPVSWVQYPLQTTLHTIGKLSCCRSGACWRSRVVPLNDGAEQDVSLCSSPVSEFARPVGRCMAIIEPQQVIAAIEACCQGKLLSSA